MASSPSGYGPDGLATYVGLSGSDALVEQCWRQALELVDGWRGWQEVYPWPIPADARGRAILEVGAELYHRKNTKNGISQFASTDGSAIRVARDPLIPAYPIWRPFIPGGFA